MITLEQHLAAHGVGDLGGRRIVCMCGWESVPATYDDAVAQHAAHQAATWSEDRTVIDRVKNIDIDDGCPCCCSWVDDIADILNPDHNVNHN